MVQKQKRRSRRGRGGGLFGERGGPGEFLDSPVGLSLDSEDSPFPTFPQPEEEEEEDSE